MTHRIETFFFFFKCSHNPFLFCELLNTYYIQDVYTTKDKAHSEFLIV